MLCPQAQICLLTSGHSLNLTRSHLILGYDSFAPFCCQKLCCLHLDHVSQETLRVLGSAVPQASPFCQLFAHRAMPQSCMMVSGSQKGCSATTSGLWLRTSQERAEALGVDSPFCTGGDPANPHGLENGLCFSLTY